MISGKRAVWGIPLIAVAAIVLTTGAVFGQNASGRIVGTVTDSQGAVIPNAKVTAVNSATQIGTEAKSDKEGNYQVLDLPIGTYQVSAEATGFAKLVTAPTPININQSLRINLKLQIGQVSETIAVEAQASGVETVNAMLGQSVTSRPVLNLPLNGRNVLDLAALQPGVTTTNTDSTAAGNFSIAGGRTDSVTYLLDGGVNNNLLNNGVVYNPNPDTIAEFRILSSNYTAEYGRNGGGVISVVTKSGTNELHGTLFEFVRNEDFNANTFFNNQAGLDRPVLKRNQFGATAGGPIIIPKMVDGRNKFFFFVGYQSQRLRQTQVNDAVTTYTPAELRGDFSHSNSAGNGPDAGVVSFLQQNPFYQPNPSLAAQGILDPTRINPTAQKYISANLIPTSASGVLYPRSSGTADSDELTEKVDLVLSQNDRISATFGSSRAPRLLPGNNVSGYSTINNVHRYFGNVAYTKVFTPTLLNEARITAQRINTLQFQPATKAPFAADLGVGITPDHPGGPPILGFNSGLTVGFYPNGPTTLINNTYSYSDTLTWVKGKHNLKAGFTFSPYQNNTLYDYFVNGEFYFYGPTDNGGIGSGNDRADFLFGLPSEYLQFGEAPSNIRSKNSSLFVQDEWRVRPNLTLTFGLRYEYSTPKKDTQGRSFSLVPGAQSTRFPNAPVGLLFPGDKGAPDGANFPDKNDFAPRFGFAYSPFKDGKTSVRGGFGVFYDILKGEDNLQFNGQAPFFGYADLLFDPLSANPTGPTNYFSDPFGATGSVNSFPSHPPAKNVDFGAAGFLPFGGGGVFFVDPHLRTPYIFQYNLSIQHEFTRGLVLEASYVGSDSHKLTSLVDVNPFILGTTTRMFNAQPGATASSFGYLASFENIGKSNYNSLQASLTKRVGDNRLFGTSYFTLAYTYGHNIDNSSGYRQRSYQVPYYNHDLFRASADTDIRQNVAFSGGWDLPIDRLWESGPKMVTKGWSLYPIVTYRTGFPLDVFAGIPVSRRSPSPSGAGDGNLIQANLVGSGVRTFNPKNPQAFGGDTANFYFDPNNFAVPGVSDADAVANPSLRTYGTLGRNAFRGPGRFNTDLALAKLTPLYRERVTAEFRAEAFNLFNNVQFNNPDTSITSGTFGQITNTADPRIIQLALRIRF